MYNVMELKKGKQKESTSHPIAKVMGNKPKEILLTI